EVAEQRAREELEAMLGGAMPEGTRFHWSNANWPIHALHELAEYERDDLIVLGAAPERIERRHVGLMERMVHGAPCAIAIAPEGYAERPAGSLSRIGVGFADTAEGRAARVRGDVGRAARGRSGDARGGHGVRGARGAPRRRPRQRGSPPRGPRAPARGLLGAARPAGTRIA